jgi:hypothetical protein
MASKIKKPSGKSRLKILHCWRVYFLYLWGTLATSTLILLIITCALGGFKGDIADALGGLVYIGSVELHALLLSVFSVIWLVGRKFRNSWPIVVAAGLLGALGGLLVILSVISIIVRLQ